VSVRDGKNEKEVVFLRQNAGGKLREFLRIEDGDNIVMFFIGSERGEGNRDCENAASALTC